MVLEAIRYVDEVVVYNTEQDLIKLLTNINPEIRILGTDYEDKNFTGQNLNIDIYWHKREHNWSTSSLRKRIWQSENEKLV
jgi:glycerol-3-phosphate cytidylyltransferase